MFESVIQFRDTTAGQIMTARPEIVALDVHAYAGQVKQTLEESRPLAHSGLRRDARSHRRHPLRPRPAQVPGPAARAVRHPLGDSPAVLRAGDQAAARPAERFPRSRRSTSRSCSTSTAARRAWSRSKTCWKNSSATSATSTSRSSRPCSADRRPHGRRRRAHVPRRRNRLLGLDLPRTPATTRWAGSSPSTLGRIPRGATFEHDGVDSR